MSFVVGNSLKELLQLSVEQASPIQQLESSVTWSIIASVELRRVRMYDTSSLNAQLDIDTEF